MTEMAVNARTYELQVGNEPLSPDVNKISQKNELCGKFVSDPDNDRKVYTIMCEKSIFGEYVTIKMIEKDVKLAINEIEFITTSEGN